MDKQLSNKQNDWSEQESVQTQRAKHHLLGSKEKFKRLSVGSRRSYRFTTTSLPSYKMTLPSVPKCSTRDNLPQPTWTSDNQAKLFVADEISTCNSRTWLGFCRSPKRLNLDMATAPNVQWPTWPNSGSHLMTCNWSCKHYCLTKIII